MTLSIRDIVKYVKWQDVKRAIKYHYPKDKNDYEKLFIELSKKKKVKTKPGEHLEVYGGLPSSPVWLEKYLPKYLEDLKTGMEDNYYGIHMKKDGDDANWSVSFIGWTYLSNMPIGLETLTHYTFEDIIAHFIWEITFYGNEKQMVKHGKELFRRAKEVKKQIAKEKQEKEKKLRPV